MKITEIPVGHVAISDCGSSIVLVCDKNIGIYLDSCYVGEQDNLDRLFDNYNDLGKLVVKVKRVTKTSVDVTVE